MGTIFNKHLAQNVTFKPILSCAQLGGEKNKENNKIK